ncbi:hypothetical protein [Acetobacter aceti]|nr:hypothetical protein [Acetobacter aceti]
MMYIDLSSDLVSTRFSAALGLITPTAATSSTTNEAITSFNASGAATILDVSSTSSSAVYDYDGPIVLIPEGDRYVPDNPGDVIDGRPASKVPGAITVNGNLETDLSSSSSTITLYTASGTAALSSQSTSSLAMLSDTNTENSEEALIAKLFSTPMDNTVKDRTDLGVKGQT